MKRLLFALAFLSVVSIPAFGQATPTARKDLDLQVGGTFTFAFPDYSPQDATGGGAYADLDFTTHYGAEIAYHKLYISQHSPASESSFEFGGRYHRSYSSNGMYRPFAKVLLGRGTFQFAPNFQQGNTSSSYWMATGGAGIDIAVQIHINVRAEFEYQKWFASDKNLPNGLNPILYNVGVAYHFGSRYDPK